MALLANLWLVLALRLTSTGFCQGKQDRASTIGPQLECTLEGLHPLLIVTYKNITILGEKVTLAHGERLAIRCRELGKYKLVGDSVLYCRNGLWNGQLPICEPTTALSNYTEDVPPTILYGLPAGSATVEPSGNLAVFPGSILHLECLFSRKLGNPEWTWTSNFRQYLTGWAIAASERDWKYRLSIYYAKAQDSGIYTCTTPKGLTNYLRVRVVDVHCKMLKTPEPPLIAKVVGPRLGEGATFECPHGYRLLGPSSITCQYNGKWSGSVPRCEAIICPELQPTNPNLQMLEQNNSYGGRAIFTCMWGSKLIGSNSLKCKGDGIWSGPMPTCSEITCPPLQPPEHGRFAELQLQQYPGLSSQGGGGGGRKRERIVHRVGSLLRFDCQPGHQLIGQASIICTENGTWSHHPPICDVRCPYPGDPPHGLIAPLKFWYKSGDTIQVTCSPGYVTPLEPVRKPTCRENGIWSGPPPPCRSYRDV
ncbi:locomotion-related protein Hikaru genki [Trichogramma pretiosum]|uniref:Locomotion-related protein Hikaru genki n=1 Tax=Trichogramma kaykai TaxID=54128 RepID=A0ABD2X386_9HYME|nr:locomotion-related protein Hikaru genki [Trichogramma pretiosum]